MNIYYVQELWFDNYYNGSDSPTASLLSIDLPTVNVKAYIALNGTGWGSDFPGSIGVGIESYDYVDDTGSHHVAVPWLRAHATVLNCTRITFGVQGIGAWGAGVGVLYWFN